MDFFGNDVDYPYRLFEIKKEFTLPELRTQYKKMVLRYHQDKNVKNVGQSKEFKILTMCYKYLLDVYKMRMQCSPVSTFMQNAHQNQDKMVSRDFCSLKQGFEEEMNRYTPEQISRLNRNFNLDKFNQEYELKKYNDPLSSKGYDDFINDPRSLHEEKIREYKNALDEIKECEGPEPIDGVDLSDCYELGGKYKNLGRTIPMSAKLHFVDYKLAHTSPKIIDEDKAVARIEYKSLDDLHAERSKPIQLSPMEANLLKQKEEQEKRIEAERMYRLQKQEQELQEYYQRTHRILMQ